MDEREFKRHCVELGVEGAGLTPEILQRIYLQKSYALIRGGATEAERERLRSIRDALTAHLHAESERGRPALRFPIAPESPTLSADGVGIPEAPANPYDLTSFESQLVNVIAPPFVAGLAVLVGQSFFGFFLRGFNIWVHEFGHATVAWLRGHAAVPLPLGWTVSSEERSALVYGIVLFFLAALFVAGLKERKPWPMILAVCLALAQYGATWRLPEETTRMWQTFAGIGGEFYLSAAMMGLFYVQLPEKFRWGGCRYFFLFIGASTFFDAFILWKKIKRGLEGIPMGSMINGEDDTGGDMNTLHDDFGWTNHQIIWTYNHLADVCLVSVVGLYLFFALRLDRVPGFVWRRRPQIKGQ